VGDHAEAGRPAGAGRLSACRSLGKLVMCLLARLFARDKGLIGLSVTRIERNTA
jgi:hypothetical protein